MKLHLCSSSSSSSSSSFFFLFLMWIVLQFGCVHGADTISRNITVSHSGKGDFSTVQAAIDSVPENNNQWIRIYVTAGTYNEKVLIPQNKPYIVLEGDEGKTVIQFNDHAAKAPGDVGIVASLTEASATFTALADYFVAKRVIFKNTYNLPKDGGQLENVSQAVAALISGDKSSLYRCGFAGYQDTLCDNHGRHVFTECWIQGAVDFIFGFAKSIYENCRLISVSRGDLPGYVTAHNRYQPDQPTGFVFKYSVVSGSGSTYLGRPWGPYARVIFYKTFMASNVTPQGWTSMSGREGELATFAEEQCFGPGSNKTGRVPWAKTLSPQETMEYVNKDLFLSAKEWLYRLP